MNILLIEGHIAIETRTRVVTYLTIVGTQLQVVHPVILLHKLLVRDDPAGTCAPEVTPTGILGKARRTIATERELDVVTAVVAIAHTTQIRLQRIVIVVV